MADKMREIFGDDSDSDDSKSQDEEVEEEEEEQQHEVQNDDSSNDEQEQENGSVKQEESENEVAAVEEEGEEEEEEEEEVEEEEHEEVQNNSVEEGGDTPQPHKSDSEEDENDKQNNQEVEAVFGDELADLSEDSDDENITRSQNKTNNVTVEEVEEEAEQIIHAEIPRVKCDFGREMHFVKLPNFLSIEPKPFSPETYEDETVEGDALDEEGKTRVKLKVENTIRWKNTTDEAGNIVKESNAKFVRWSDGSLSLHLGNEIFDVYKQYMQGDHNHLFIRQGSGLQGQGVFRTKLAFRPHSTDSLTHRKMTMSLVDSGQKTQKVKILTDVISNPDAKRSEMIKKEEERLKAQSKRENKQRRIREKSHSKGLSAEYLEDKYSDDDDNGVSLSAIKSKFKSGGRNDSINSSGDESDRERRLNKAKSYNDDDSDNERNQTKKKKKIVADDDE